MNIKPANAATLSSFVADAFKIGGRSTKTQATQAIIDAAASGKIPDLAVPVKARTRYAKADPAKVKDPAWDKDIASRIDHTLLNPALVTPGQLSDLCEEAAVYRFRSVCVWPHKVAEAKRLLAGTGIPIAAVVGFPEGLVSDAKSASDATSSKMKEARAAVRDGAQDIDMVANSSLLLTGYEETLRGDIPIAYTKYWKDVYLVMAASTNQGDLVGRTVIPKVIMQTENLRKQVVKQLPKTATDDEKKKAQDEIVRISSQLTLRAISEAADMGFLAPGQEVYLKTSCGVYSTASLADVRIMAEETAKMQQLRKEAGASAVNVCIKVAGGVANKAQAREYIELVKGICGEGVKVIFGTSSGVDVASKDAPPAGATPAPASGPKAY
jgi:deoxyribose-phosphate aldolase